MIRNNLLEQQWRTNYMSHDTLTQCNTLQLFSRIRYFRLFWSNCQNVLLNRKCKVHKNVYRLLFMF